MINLNTELSKKNQKGLRLIDDSHHVQASDGTGVLGSLALSIVEVSGDGDHGMCNLSKKKWCLLLTHDM